MRASLVSQQAYRVAEDAIWFVQLRALATLNTTPNHETPFSNRAASRPTRELLN